LRCSHNSMNPTKRIALILTVIFLIPALFFSVYEISSLSKDEKMIEGIYQKQLEAILFSVNQYADNALYGWVAKVEAGHQAKTENGELPPSMQTLLANSAVHAAFIVDTIGRTSAVRIFSLDSLSADSLRAAINESLAKSSTQIQQLLKYKKSGFQKVEAIQSRLKHARNFQVMIFIVEADALPLQIAGLIIDPAILIEDLIGPRLQIISKDQFILSAFNKVTKARVYSTALSDTTAQNSDALTKDLWIFPDYSLGIRTRGASLKQIVRERTNTNLILLVGLDAVLIIALILAFRSVKREVQLAQNKSDFVANVSHEIRTPLALISMFAETLEMGRVKSEEKKQEYYTIITKETHRLSGIVNKILNFSQTEAGKKTLHIEPVDLSKEILDILKTYDFHLKNKGFEYHFEEGPNLFVKADKEALTEIIINLIDNAIKYSTDKKRIKINVGSNEEFGWISIKDHGLGISKADQKHIFDKFYRVSSGNLAKSQGTGLGLSLVKQLMEKQNGKISVTSELGQGSVFMLYFPLAK
jgi:two-component system, OmpR family, phosphate regulon sensor histidine kinase PhoR